MGVGGNRSSEGLLIAMGDAFEPKFVKFCYAPRLPYYCSTRLAKSLVAIRRKCKE